MTTLPAGRYFSVIGSIRPRAGGQTRVLLTRHRLFAARLGVDMPILTFNDGRPYGPLRDSLVADGLLLPTSRIINLHEDLRERDLGALPTVEAPPVPGAVEHRRADGTVYLRAAPSGDGVHLVLDRDGRAVAATSTLGGLWRWWALLVAGRDERVFFVSDSRFIAEELSLIDEPDVYVLHQMHAVHTVGARHWTSPIGDSYAASMASLARLDAFGILTGAQRDDVVRRFGATDNLVVIPNPVEPVDVPDPLPERTSERIVTIGRLHHHKRMDRAVEAFALVAARRPAARLDIYGSGPDLDDLTRQVTAAGLEDRVTLHGHDPFAAEQLWTSDVAWLTGAFEGFGLFILEARARGCPVLSFDVPYGPREQIRDGFDGVLVPPADVEALADATCDLFEHRERLEAMRPRAQEAAEEYNHERFLADWADAVSGAIARKPHRTRLDEVRVERERLTLPRGRRPLRLDAAITVCGAGDLDGAHLCWQAWTSVSPDPLELPAVVQREHDTWTIVGDVPPAVVAALRGTGRPVHLRLLLVCRNSSWQHELHAGPLSSSGRARRLAAGIARRLRTRTGSQAN